MTTLVRRGPRVRRTDERPEPEFRRRCGGTAIWPPPTPPGLPPTGGTHATHALYRSLLGRTRVHRPAPGVGAPPPGARRAHLPRRPRPHGSGPGGRPDRRGPARGDHRRGGRHGHRQRPGARRRRGHRPRDHPADRAGRDAAGRALAADPQRRAADAARPRAGDLAAPARRRRSGSWPRRPCAASARTLDGRGFTEIQTPEDRRLGDRVAARTSSRSTTSAGRRTSPRARSSTSSRWSACSSGSTRSGRCSGPSRTTRCATWPSTSPSTPSSASSSDHRDVMAVLRDVVAGMVARDPRVRRRGGRADRRGRAGGAGGDPGHPLPRRAGAGRRAGRTEPDLAPEHERCARGVGAGRARQRLRVRRGLPDGEAAVLHAPAARRPALVEQLRPALPRARAGHGRPAAAPARRTTTRRSGRAARTRRRTRRTSQAFRHGMPPHGGFAIGLERWTSRLTGQRERARGHALPAGPEPTHPVTGPTKMRFIHTDSVQLQHVARQLGPPGR